jgi:Cu/Ag efflux protein CusF
MTKLSPDKPDREDGMAGVRSILANVAVLTIIGSAALAQEDQTTGRIIRIDQANGMITLQHRQGGTVGAVGADNLVDIYKMKDGLTLNGLNALEAGDRVVFTEAQIGGVRTVTKIEKQ